VQLNLPDDGDERVHAVGQAVKAVPEVPVRVAAHQVVRDLETMLEFKKKFAVKFGEKFGVCAKNTTT
jgi:hypothetical protein